MIDISTSAENTNKQLAKNLAVYRKAQKMSRNALSRNAGATPSLVNKIENERRRVDIGEFLRLCAGLAINPINVMAQLKVTTTTFAAVRLDENQTEQNLNKANLNKDFKTNARFVGQLVGQQMKTLRNTADITMRNFALKLGTPHSFVGKIEWCTRRLDVGEFIYMCEQLNQDATTVLGDVIAQANASVDCDN